MRRHWIRWIVILGSLTIIASNTVKAQTDQPFVISIPFALIVDGRILPAGKPAIQQIDPTKPNVVMIKNLDNGMVRLLITQRIENLNTSSTSSLIFVRRQDVFYLAQIWPVGSNEGRRVPFGERDNKSHQQDRSTLFD